MKTASWVIREKATKKVVMETFDERKVRALNKAKYEAIPILKYLQEFNAKVKGNPMKRKKSYRKNPDHKTVDVHAATELDLFVSNDATLHRQMVVPILKNLARKSKKGVYNIDLAVKAWGYLMKAGADKYAKDFGSRGDTGSKMFNAATRLSAAKEWEAAYRGQVIQEAQSL